MKFLKGIWKSSIGKTFSAAMIFSMLRHVAPMNMGVGSANYTPQTGVWIITRQFYLKL